MFRKIIKKLGQSDIFRSLTTLISGTFIAQLIPLFLQPFLRRMYLPEEFGFYSLYISYAGILSVIFSLRYDQVIPILKSNRYADLWLRVVIAINFLVLIILICITLLFKVQLNNILSLPEEQPYLIYYIIVSAYLFSTYQSYNLYLIRNKKFKQSSINKVMRRLIEGVTQLSLGLAQPIITNLGLIIGELAGRLINTLQVFGAPKRSSNFRVRSIKRVRFLIKRYKDFPKINLPSNLMNTLCLLLPIIIVNSKFGDEITGYFDLTRVVLTVPFALISVSTSQVLFQKTSEAINKKTGFKSTFKVIIIPLLILSVLSIITITFFAIPIFELFFGPQWNLSAEISKILIFSASVRLVVSPLSITLLSLEKIKTMTLWQTSYFIMITSLFFLPFKNIISFIKVYMIIQLTAYLVYFLLILFEVNKYHTKLKLNMNA